MTDMAGGRRPSGLREVLRVLLCAALALIVPIVYFWIWYGEIRGALGSGGPQWADRERVQAIWMRLLRAELIGDLSVTFGLAVLACLALRLRQVRRPVNGAARVMPIVGFVTAAILAPWVASGLTSLDLSAAGPFERWVRGNLFRNLVPAIGAVVAGVLFWLTTSRDRRASAAA